MDESAEILESVVTELWADPPRPGRPRVTRGDRVRDLTAADMEALAGAPRGRPTPVLQSIRASHHALAKCLAAGMRPAQAALVTGYHAQRITQLQADPTFRALLADYQTEARNIFADMTERMSNVSLDALDLVQERLNDKPEDFSIPMLLDVIKTFADRTGHGPNQEVALTVRSADMIDRPPRETHEEWQARRARELAAERASLESPTGATN